ncbi:MAG: hypothetical protein R3Y56_07870 [Akkermansia sp.]
MSLFLTVGFHFILKHSDGFQNKVKFFIILFGTYWYNIIYIPITILLAIGQGELAGAPHIIILGPILFLIPSLIFCWSLQRRIKN